MIIEPAPGIEPGPPRIWTMLPLHHAGVFQIRRPGFEPERQFLRVTAAANVLPLNAPPFAYAAECALESRPSVALPGVEPV